MKKVAAFTPYFTEAEAEQVRAAFPAVGGAEGYASVSDLIVGATMREVKRLQRRHHQAGHGTRFRPVRCAADSGPKINCNTGKRTDRPGT